MCQRFTRLHFNRCIPAESAIRHTHAGAWFIPKGEVDPGEDEFAAAKREFREETGIEAGGEFIALGTVKNTGGKIVHAWAFQGDCNPASIRSNTFMLEWPPRSGRKQEFPEVDRAEFMSVEQARVKMSAAEFELVERLFRSIRR